MHTLNLLLAEIGYRKLNFALAALAVVVAAALFVAGPCLVDGYSRETQAQIAAAQSATEAIVAKMGDETRKLMIGMGFNLLIVPEGTNMADFWASDFAAADMPQDYVVRLGKDRRLTYVTHLVATLQEKIAWQDRKVLLAGYLPETKQAFGEKKKPMGYVIEPGTVWLGFELGREKKVGDPVDILGRSFRVAKLLPEKGSKEDITLAVHLQDAQSLLKKPGQINQIMALGCNCAGSNLPGIRRQVGEILPHTQVTEFNSIAVARAEQRELVAQRGQQQIDQLAQRRAGIQATLETLAGVVVPLVVLVCAAWLGVLAWVNVRQRREEIGLLRAIGKTSSTIATLLLGKAVLLGLLGGALGFALGVGLVQLFGTRALEVSAGRLAVRLDMLAYCLLGAPLLAAIASYLPTLSAILEDPAVALREQ